MPNLRFRQKKWEGHPKLGKNSTNSDLAQTFRVISDQQNIVIRGENLPPPPSQNSILGTKKGREHPKLGKNSTNSDLAQTFRATSDQQKIVIRGENIPSPLSKNSILGKKRGGVPQIRQKINQLGFGSNFQGNLRPTKDCDLR